jgi:hypothetical protein
MNFQELLAKMAQLDQPMAETAEVVAEAPVTECPAEMTPAAPIAPEPSLSVNLNAQGLNNIADLIKLIAKAEEGSEEEHSEMKNRNKYDNFTIYKIVSKNEDDDNIYSGSTIDFERRKEQHRKAVDNKNGIQYYTLLYRYIRNNGGWENWTIEILDHYPQCKTLVEATTREQEWITKLNPSLNVCEAHTTPEEKRILANAWKRESESHHKYNAEYCKNLTEAQKKQINVKQRERYALQTREQKDARNAKLKEKRDRTI